MQNHDHQENAELDHQGTQSPQVALQAYERFWEHQLTKLKEHVERAGRGAVDISN
jgi:threonine aldolase